MDDYIQDFVDMEPFEILMKYVESVQGNYKQMSPGWCECEVNRSKLQYPFRVALGGIEYVCSLLEDLQRLQSDLAISDVTIKVDGRVFHGHRCVLAAASRFFEAMFSADFLRSKAKEIELKDMDADIFEVIFNFMYSGKMDIYEDEDRAIPALNAAAYLEVRNAERVFVDYFDGAFNDIWGDPIKILTVWDAAENHDMEELSATAYTHLLSNFQSIVDSDLFFEKAPSKLINDYLKRENADVSFTFGRDCNGEKLLRRIIQWLKHDWENRKGDAYELLQRFRLGLIPKDKVQELIDDQILEVPECREIMDDLMEKWAEFEGAEDPLKLPESFLPRGMRRTLIALGGKQVGFDMFDEYDSDDSIDMQPIREKELFGHYFNKTDGEWTRLNYLPLPGKAQELEYPSMVVVNKDIYLAGGVQHDDGDDSDYEEDSANVYESKRCFKLDGKSYKWTELPPMTHARSRFALVHLDGFLYAVGGIQDRRASSGKGKPAETQYLKSVERFNLSTQKWDGIYNLPVPLAYTSAAIVEGKILVYGLKDHVGEEGEFWLVGFDPVTHKWREIAQERYAARRSPPDCILVVHDGGCYRVKYEWESRGWRKKYTPHVNLIELKPGSGVLRGCIGREVEGQDTLPDYYDVIVFHIDGHIYLNIGRFAHKTGAIQGDPNSDVKGLNGWRKCRNMDKKCVVEYAFDSKKMLSPVQSYFLVKY